MTTLVWFVGSVAFGVALVCLFLGVWVEGLVSAAVAVAAFRAAYGEA